jgi:mannose-6-phosphate isomerase-like protein (cupin superfamily)
MKATFTIETFPLCGSAIHVAPGGHASVMRGSELKSRLRQLPDGLLLGTFQIEDDVDAHSHVWEMHPMGDEMLVMLTGSLEVEYADGPRRATSLLGTRQCMVMPGGVWHRLEVREPGLLLTLTPLQGTLHSEQPGERP